MSTLFLLLYANPVSASIFGCLGDRQQGGQAQLQTALRCPASSEHRQGYTRQQAVPGAHCRAGESSERQCWQQLNMGKEEKKKKK